MVALRIGGKIRIIVLGAAAVAILVPLIWLVLFRERPATYESVLAPDNRVSRPSVLNVETGELVPIDTAILQKTPYIGVMHIGEERTFGSVLTALTTPEYSYTVFLRVAGVDLEFAAADASGKPMHDYWADADGRKWPAIPQRQTSSYGWLVAPENRDRRILFRTFGGTAGVFRITALDERSVRLRCRIVERASSGAGAAPEDSERFVARWPEGAGVEFIGISRHPSAGSEWWTPDGSPLARPPYLVRAPVLADQNDTAAYEIAYRFLDLDREQVHAGKARVPQSPSMVYARPCDEFGHACSDCAASAFLFGEEARSAVVEFGLAAGAWQTILATRDGGEIGRDDAWIVRISPPAGTERGVTVELTIARAWTDNYAWRFVAVDNNGDLREVRQASRDAGHTESSPLEQHRFHVPHILLSDIKEFRFDVCPCRWLRFKNVSLRPGRDFGCQIEPPPPQTPDPQAEPGP